MVEQASFNVGVEAPPGPTTAAQEEKTLEAGPALEEPDALNTTVEEKHELHSDTPATSGEQTNKTNPSVPAELSRDNRTANPGKDTSTDIGPEFPDLPSDHPLTQLIARLPAVLESADYSEVYGVDMSNPTSGHTKNILQKFLRANANDVVKAEEQLLATLKWRKEFQPLKALDEEEHSRSRFGGLGFVTTLKSVPGFDADAAQVVTWNVYGAVKDNKVTFGDVDRYCRSCTPAGRRNHTPPTHS